MTEQGIVTYVNEKKRKATVRFSRKSACENCGMCAFKKDEMFVKCVMENTLNAKVGDTVAVNMGQRYVLTAALIVYVIPLILCAIALACTFMLKEYVQIIGVGVCLVLGFAISAILDRKVIRKKKGFRPKMVGIIDKTDQKEEDTDNE